MIGSARRLTDGHAAGERAIIVFVHDEVAGSFVTCQPDGSCETTLARTFSGVLAELRNDYISAFKVGVSYAGISEIVSKSQKVRQPRLQRAQPSAAFVGVGIENARGRAMSMGNCASKCPRLVGGGIALLTRVVRSEAASVPLHNVSTTVMSDKLCLQINGP